VGVPAGMFWRRVGRHPVVLQKGTGHGKVLKTVRPSSGRYWLLQVWKRNLRFLVTDVSRKR
jgi:hypothetical protein